MSSITVDRNLLTRISRKRIFQTDRNADRIKERKFTYNPRNSSSQTTQQIYTEPDPAKNPKDATYRKPNKEVKVDPPTKDKDPYNELDDTYVATDNKETDIISLYDSIMIFDSDTDWGR